jgi:hydroxymethylbilane synthase
MRLGTRASALALAQAQSVADRLQIGRQDDVELVPIVTRGDRGADGEDKSRWVGELESALIRGEIDVAVHSAKDLPGELGAGLALAGAPARAGAEDVLCGADSLLALPAHARVGTSSIRRAAQLRAARADLRVVAMRGNVDTRLGKLERGDFDAIVLARAGLQRLGREDALGVVLDPARFVPAPGQGTIALEARADDQRAQDALAVLIDADAFSSLLAERALAHALDASCETPLGAHAAPFAGGLRMRAWLGLPDGSAWIGDELLGEFSDPQGLGRSLADRLKLVGAGELLSHAREMAEREALDARAAVQE